MANAYNQNSHALLSPNSTPPYRLNYEQEGNSNSTEAGTETLNENLAEQSSPCRTETAILKSIQKNNNCEMSSSDSNSINSINGGNPSSSGNQLFNVHNDVFVSKLIEAVRRHPCLFNPNHEHYGNKHASGQFRAAVWKSLCKELDFKDDPHVLQTQWKRVRDRYVRERRKRKLMALSGRALNAEGNQGTSMAGEPFLLRDFVKAETANRRRLSSITQRQTTEMQGHDEFSTTNQQSAASRHFHEMQFLDEFLSTSESNLTPGLSTNSMRSSSGEIYYSQPPNRSGDTTKLTKKNLEDDIIKYEQNNEIGMSSQLLNSSSNLNENNNNSLAITKTESGNGSPSSTSSEISVGSAVFGNLNNNNTKNTGLLQQQQQHQSKQLTQQHLMFRQGCGDSSGTLDVKNNNSPRQFLNSAGRNSNLNNGTISTQFSDPNCSTSYQLVAVPQQHSGYIQTQQNLMPPQQQSHHNLDTIVPKNEQIMTMIIEQPQPVTSSAGIASFAHNYNFNGIISGNETATTSQPKMYRLVNYSANSSEIPSQQQFRSIATTSSPLPQLLTEHHQQQQSPPRKRMAFNQSQQQQQQNSKQQNENRSPQLLLPEQERILINSQQLGPQQQLNYQHNQILPQHHLINRDNRSTTSAMIIQPTSQQHHQQQLHHHNQQQQLQQNSHQLHDNSNTHLQQQHRLMTTPVRGVAATIRGSQQASDLQQQQHHQQQQQIHAVAGNGTGGYILATGHGQHQVSNQQHYDPEAALVETIVTHLGNLNDDEKVVTKMNIQRILMDARFGRGACVRMFREEEQSENMAAALEQRHLQQNSINNPRR